MTDFSTSKVTGRQVPWESNPTHRSGGGGDPPDNMNARIEALEEGHRAILAKLDGISSLLVEGRSEAKETTKAITELRIDNERRLGPIDTKLAVLEERVDRTADATSLATLTGKIGNVEATAKALPTTKEMIALTFGTLTLALIGITGIAFAVAKFAPAVR